jgi:hypothetical protein
MRHKRLMTQITDKRRHAYRLGENVGKPQGERLVTKRQLARHLSFSERWIEMQVRNGMPHLRVGSRLRFRISEVEAYFDGIRGGR